MRVITGDLWTVDADWRVVPTNLVVRRNGHAVMGAGVALQAARRYPDLPRRLGDMLQRDDILKAARLVHFSEYRLTCLPTKRHWRDAADLGLVEHGVRQLVEDAEALPVNGPIALPLLGCGLGKLPATTVRPFLERVLDERFVLVLTCGR